MAAIAPHQRGTPPRSARTGGAAAGKQITVTAQQKKAVTTTITKLEHQSPAICFVVAIDISLSMNGGRLVEALNGFRDLMQSMRKRQHPKDLVKIVTFNHEQTVILGYTRVSEFTEAYMNAVLAPVAAAGGTAIYDTLQSMLDDLNTAQASRRGRMTEFILLTDGDDQHSRRGGSSASSCEMAKRRLAKPGCPNFSLSLLYVGNDSDGLTNLRQFESGVAHFRLKPCKEATIRQCFRSVMEEITQRVNIVTIETVRRTRSAGGRCGGAAAVAKAGQRKLTQAGTPRRQGRTPQRHQAKTKRHHTPAR